MLSDRKIDGVKAGISRMLIIYILLFSALMTFLGTFLQLYIDYTSDIKSIKKTMAQIESSYLESINLGLWGVDDEQVKLQLNGILHFPDMQYLEIEQDGELLFSAGEPAKKNILQQEFQLSYTVDSKINPLGVLRATAGLSGIYNRLKKRIFVILSTEAVKMFLASAFIFYLFYILVGKHLVFMADYAQHLDFRRLSIPLKLNRTAPKKNDELELLAQSINVMRKNLANDIKDRQLAALKLEHLNDELLLKNKELEQIVYVASHDLRSPLVNVQGFSKELGADCEEIRKILQDDQIPEKIKNTIDPILQDDIPNSLEFILTSVTKMDSLLTGLLKLSRLGRAAIEIRTIDMNVLVASVAASMEFQMKKANISIKVNVLPSCASDATQVNQVFSNLIMNAVKYIDPNRKGEITISGKTEDGFSIYSVTDNGVGIAKEHQSKIFEIFHQLSPKKNEGEGLGLNIVKKIMDWRRGRVWLESEPGKGSTFFVSFQTESREINETL